MSYDLTLAQSHAFQLSRDLMVPVTVFEVDGEYPLTGRLPLPAGKACGRTHDRHRRFETAGESNWCPA